MTQSTILNSSGVADAANEARRHLTSVLPALHPTESIEIRCLDMRSKPAREGPRHFVSTIDEAVELAMTNRERWDVFFGVGTRACPSALVMADCRHAEKGADHIARINCVWGDFDTHSRCFDDVVADLQALSLAPDLLVASGKGVHSYWLLTEPTEDLAAVKAINKSFRIRLGADNAIDPARILRIAGTLNHKRGESLPVRLLTVSDAV